MRVLLVEDNVDHAEMVRRLMETSGGFELVHVRSGADATAAIDQATVDVAVIDYRLPDTEGVKLCQDLRAKGHVFPIIMVTVAKSESLVRRAFDAGADDFVVKGPSFAEHLLDEIREHGEGAG